MKKLVAAAVIAASTIGAASAADLPSRKAPMIEAPLPILTWSGFYAGVNIGGTWTESGRTGHAAFAGGCDPAFPGCAFTPNYSVTLASISTFRSGGSSTSGVIGGGQIGYNWQFGPSFVLGLEADIQGIAQGNKTYSVYGQGGNPNFPNLEAYAARVNRTIDYLGTVRGRIGFLAAPTLMLYATGGLAYAGVSGSIQQATILTSGSDFAVGTSGSGFSKTRVGYTVGGGLEWMFLPNWSVKGEYLYYDLGRVTYATALNQVCVTAGCAAPGGIFASTVGAASTRFNGHIARLGVNYHFNWGTAPVVARY